MAASVRARITMSAALLLLVVLGLTGFALVSVQRSVLTDNLDEVLEAHANEVASVLAQDPPAELPAGSDDDAFALVLDAAGDRVAVSGRPPSGVESLRPGFATVGGYRVLTRHSASSVVAVGTPLDDVDESVGTLTAALLVSVPLAAALLAVGAWILVGRALRPVESIRSQVALISGASLDHRIAVPGTRDEIAALAATMNDMLSRIQVAADRERQFISDASHELRSPVGRMRTALEVDAAYPAEVDAEATRAALLDNVLELGALIDDLLLVARIDDPGYRPDSARIDLDDLVLAAVEHLPAGGPDVDLRGMTAAQVTGDARALSRVVGNLLENAERHSGGIIAVTVRERGGWAELIVEDDGPGVPASDRDRVFDRFGRLDDSRSASTGGTGLGLAIARDVVRAHGGTITVGESALGGARFHVRLPAAGARV